MRVPRTDADQLLALDDHVELLRAALVGLRITDRAYLKVIAAELRVLICRSSGSEGLLTRLIQRWNVNDAVEAFCSSAIGLPRIMSPLGPTLSINVFTPGAGRRVSLNTLLAAEACWFEGTAFTFEQLIKLIAEQVGTAHEDKAIHPVIASLFDQIPRDSTNVCQLFDFLSEMTLQIAERVFAAAAEISGFRRSARPGKGDLSLLLAVMPAYAPQAPPLLFEFVSHAADATIEYRVSCENWKCNVRARDVITALGRGTLSSEITDPIGIYVQYSSNRRTARVGTTDGPAPPPFPVDLGWLDGRTTSRRTKFSRRRFPEQQCISTCGIWDRLLSFEELRAYAAAPSEPALLVGHYPARIRDLNPNPADVVDELFRAAFDQSDTPDFS